MYCIVDGTQSMIFNLLIVLVPHFAKPIMAKSRATCPAVRFESLLIASITSSNGGRYFKVAIDPTVASPVFVSLARRERERAMVRSERSRCQQKRKSVGNESELN